MKNNLFIKFTVLTFLLILINELLKVALGFDKLMQNYLAELLTATQIENYFKLQQKWKFLGYLFIPLFILIKTTLVTSVLYVGVFFFSKIEVAFYKIWSIVVSAEFIFLLVPIFKLIWLYFFQTTYNLEDFQYFYPLSALNITGFAIDKWFIYPFQVLNLFELAYVIYLGNQIGKITETNSDIGFKIVGYSYLPALLFWVVLIMFLTLNYS